MKSESSTNHRMSMIGPDGHPLLRVWRRAPRGKQSARLLIKCGDCDESLKIYYGGDSVEIGGVHAGVEEWKRILLPLLQIDSKPARSKRLTAESPNLLAVIKQAGNLTTARSEPSLIPCAPPRSRR